MKRFWLLACVLVLMATPSWASSIGAGVGYWDTEEAGDDNGFGLRVSVDAGPNWNVDLRAAFFDAHGDVFGPRLVDIEATPIDFGLSYDVNPGGPATVYVGGGLNYTLYKSEVFNFVTDLPEASRIKDEPGWYAVVGVDFELPGGGWGVFLEALYRQNKPEIRGDGLNEFAAIPIDFAGVGATAGISFNW